MRIFVRVIAIAENKAKAAGGQCDQMVLLFLIFFH